MKTKVFLSGLFFLIFLVSSFANTNNPSDEWKIYKEYEGISIYYKSIVCSDADKEITQEFIVLKIVNKTNNDVVLSWDLQTWYNGVCRTCDINDGTYHFSITVISKDSVNGACNGENSLRIFSRVILKSKEIPGIEKFELANLVVKNI